MPSHTHPDPRRTALEILNALDRERRPLDQLLDEVQNTDAGKRFTRKDRSLFYAITYGVLRWRSRLDWFIDHYSNIRLNKINPAVLNILRISLFQILFLDKIPVSAAVNTAVQLTKSVAPPWVVRYTNGVLRNVARGHQTLAFPDMARDPAAALAVIHSFPKWLIEKWLARFGTETTVALCKAINTIPPVTLRTNTLKTTPETLTHAIEDQVATVRRTAYAPDGISLFGLNTSIPDMKTFQEGWFQVQDEAAQLVTLFLDPQPGETVLDACAGLGGKTGHIAQAMNNRGRVVAVDSNREKLSRLQTEMKRLGISIVTTERADLATPGLRLPIARFDRVLLDAPCSGLGVLRRNPDTKWRTETTHPANHGKRQAVLLDNLSSMVKPNGILVYAVCSTEPEENEAVVKSFLNNHPDFVMAAQDEKLPTGVDKLSGHNGYLKTFPHRHDMDGFFAARLKRVK